MISIENLVKRHGKREVLHGVGLEARTGRVTGFVGPNGAGKSSTLRCLLGLDRADAGGTVLLSSHVLAEVAEVADVVVVIAGGRVRAAGTLEEVAAGYASLEEAFFSLTSPTGDGTGGPAGQTRRGNGSQA